MSFKQKRGSEHKSNASINPSIQDDPDESEDN